MKETKKLLSALLALVMALSLALPALANEPAATGPNWTRVPVKASAEDEIPAGAYFIDWYSLASKIRTDQLIMAIKRMLRAHELGGNPADPGVTELKLLYPDAWAAACEESPDNIHQAEVLFIAGLDGDDVLATLNAKMAALRAAYPDLVYWFDKEEEDLFVGSDFGLTTDGFEKLGVIYLAETWPEEYAAIPGAIQALMEDYTQAAWYADLNFSEEGSCSGYLRIERNGEELEPLGDLFCFLNCNAAWKEVKPTAENLRNGDYYIDDQALRALFEQRFAAICDEGGETVTETLPLGEPGDESTVTLTKEEYLARETTRFLDRTTLFVNPGDELFSVKVQTEQTFVQEPPESRDRYIVTYLPLAEKGWENAAGMTAEQCWSLIRLYEAETPDDPGTQTDPTGENPADSGINSFLTRIIAFFQKLLQLIRGWFGG